MTKEEKIVLGLLLKKANTGDKIVTENELVIEFEEINRVDAYNVMQFFEARHVLSKIAPERYVICCDIALLRKLALGGGVVTERKTPSTSMSEITDCEWTFVEPPAPQKTEEADEDEEYDDEADEDVGEGAHRLIQEILERSKREQSRKTQIDDGEQDKSKESDVKGAAQLYEEEVLRRLQNKRLFDVFDGGEDASQTPTENVDDKPTENCEDDKPDVDEMPTEQLSEEEVLRRLADIVAGSENAAQTLTENASQTPTEDGGGNMLEEEGDGLQVPLIENDNEEDALRMCVERDNERLRQQGGVGPMMGKFVRKLDKFGRLTIPSKWVDAFTDGMVFIMPEEGNKLILLPLAAAKLLKGAAKPGSRQVKMDAQCRIKLLPDFLVQLDGNEVWLFGALDRIMVYPPTL